MLASAECDDSALKIRRRAPLFKLLIAVADIHGFEDVGTDEAWQLADPSLQIG
jgi:hypothetical protein